MAVAAYASLRPLEDSLSAILKLQENRRIDGDNCQQFRDLRNKVRVLLHFLEALPLPHNTMLMNSPMRTLVQKVKVAAHETELFLVPKITKILCGNGDELQSFTQDLEDTIRNFELMVVSMRDGLVSYIQDKVKSVLQLLCDRQSEILVMPGTEDSIEEISVMVVEIQLYMNAEVMDLLGENGDSLSSFMKRVMEKLQSIEKGLRIVDKQDEPVADQSSMDSAQFVSSEVDTRANTNLVGLEEKVSWMKRELTSHVKNLQIISIVGMGGIGKTTLAQNVFENPFIQERFGICKWCRVSKNYTEREILQSLLGSEKCRLADSRELGTKLYQSLRGSKYLIVMDDVWSVEPWEYVKQFLPENEKGSRVIITTRENDVATRNSNKQCIMELLDEDLSWNLLCTRIFGKQQCPSELENVGRKIAKHCNGLPIALVTMAGVLLKSNMALIDWKNVEQNVKEVSRNGECMDIMSLSYNYLPVHLKACFLWLRFIQVDYDVIYTRYLITDWIAEGFVQPMFGKSLEDVAIEYLNELVDRNLVICKRIPVSLYADGFSIHDLLRDLCEIESRKEDFLRNTRRCQFKSDDNDDDHNHYDLDFLEKNQVSSLTLYIKRTKAFPQALLEGPGFLPFPLHHYHWNLQILEVISNKWISFPTEIWEMQNLRHLTTEGLFFPELSESTLNESRRNHPSPTVLDQLQTLSANGWFGEDIVKRIPNLKILELNGFVHGMDCSCLGALEHLQSLSLALYDIEGIKFPRSLKQLLLFVNEISTEHMAAMASLEFLEILKLYVKAQSDELIVMGKFPKLRFLTLAYVQQCPCKLRVEEDSGDLLNLEKIKLQLIANFEFPDNIEELTSLDSIDLTLCSDSVFNSAIQMLQEQRDKGNETPPKLVVDWRLLIFLDNDDDGGELFKFSDRNSIHVEEVFETMDKYRNSGFFGDEFKDDVWKILSKDTQELESQYSRGKKTSYSSVDDLERSVDCLDMYKLLSKYPEDDEVCSDAFSMCREALKLYIKFPETTNDV